MNDRMNPAIAIIRLLVGWVFCLEGILKFLMVDELGAGRFTAICIPAPLGFSAARGRRKLVAGRNDREMEIAGGQTC